VGGLSGTSLRARRLTRALNLLPFVRTDAPSQITVDAELATSRPSPNQVGVAYVETFESGGRHLPRDRREPLGVRQPPLLGAGAGAGRHRPVAGFQDQDAAHLTWQSLIGTATGVVQYRARDIDPSIVVQGTGRRPSRCSGS